MLEPHAGPNADPHSNKDIGRRDVSGEVTLNTTLHDLIFAHFENACFDGLYYELGHMQRGQTDADPAHRLMQVVHAGTEVDPSAFAPTWLQRVRELLDEIAKENGYEPPSHPGADASRPDPSHED